MAKKDKDKGDSVGFDGFTAEFVGQKIKPVFAKTAETPQMLELMELMEALCDDGDRWLQHLIETNGNGDAELRGAPQKLTAIGYRLAAHSLEMHMAIDWRDVRAEAMRALDELAKCWQVLNFNHMDVEKDKIHDFGKALYQACVGAL